MRLQFWASSHITSLTELSRRSNWSRTDIINKGMAVSGHHVTVNRHLNTLVDISVIT